MCTHRSACRRKWIPVLAAMHANQLFCLCLPCLHCWTSRLFPSTSRRVGTPRYVAETDPHLTPGHQFHTAEGLRSIGISTGPSCMVMCISEQSNSCTAAPTATRHLRIMQGPEDATDSTQEAQLCTFHPFLFSNTSKQAYNQSRTSWVKQVLPHWKQNAGE